MTHRGVINKKPTNSPKIGIIEIVKEKINTKRDLPNTGH